MSASYHILYWRDIPSMVKAKIGRKRYSRPLPDRFMEFIDAAAMKTGDVDTDDYLEHWRSSDPIPIEGDPDECLDRAAAELDEQYPRERLVALAKNGGSEPDA
ncbi:MAG: virulence factor [Pseudomonadota bacterium]